MPPAVYALDCNADAVVTELLRKQLHRAYLTVGSLYCLTESSETSPTTIRHAVYFRASSNVGAYVVQMVRAALCWI